jgi:hypothetical protein
MQINHPVFIRQFSYACLLLHLLIQYTAKLHISLSIASTQFRAQGSRGIREQRLHVILGVVIALGSVGIIRNISNSLENFRGELDLPASVSPLFYNIFAVLKNILGRFGLNIGRTESLVVPRPQSRQEISTENSACYSMITRQQSTHITACDETPSMRRSSSRIPLRSSRVRWSHSRFSR